MTVFEEAVLVCLVEQIPVLPSRSFQLPCKPQYTNALRMGLKCVRHMHLNADIAASGLDRKAVICKKWMILPVEQMLSKTAIADKGIGR